MFIVHMRVHVKPELVDAFREATPEKTGHPSTEPGPCAPVG
jgi:hypothetical protein